MKTPLSSILLVLLASFIGSFGMVFLKSGAERLHFNLKSLITNWRLAVGVTLFVLSSVFFLMGVKHGELTVLYPMVALGYIFTMVWSRLFFNEPFTKNKIVGIGMIMLGILILQMGNQ